MGGREASVVGGKTTTFLKSTQVFAARGGQLSQSEEELHRFELVMPSRQLAIKNPGTQVSLKCVVDSREQNLSRGLTQFGSQ